MATLSGAFSAFAAACGPIAVLAVFVCAPAVATHGEPVRRKPAILSTARWTCNAYGRDTRHWWLTVTGTPQWAKIDAQHSAISECSRKLWFCSLSGCWHD
jgi:hypothetical protein